MAAEEHVDKCWEWREVVTLAVTYIVSLARVTSIETVAELL